MITLLHESKPYAPIIVGYAYYPHTEILPEAYVPIYGRADKELREDYLGELLKKVQDICIKHNCFIQAKKILIARRSFFELEIAAFHTVLSFNDDYQKLINTIEEKIIELNKQFLLELRKGN